MQKNYPKKDYVQEGFNILTGAIGRIGGTADSSVWSTQIHL